MKRFFVVEAGKPVEIASKTCATCGDTFPLDELHFKRRISDHKRGNRSMKSSRGWGRDCNRCGLKRIARAIREKADE